MSLFWRATKRAYPEIPPPGQAGNTLAGTVRVSTESALRASAVWAGLRLRADLVSTMPVDNYRRVDNIPVQVRMPNVTWVSGGHEIEWHEFIYSTQMDLDRSGNTFGVITEKNALGLPTRIELANLADVGVIPPRNPGDRPLYRIAGQEVTADNVWHERQYTLPGLAVGLSPIAYAAWSIGAYLSAQEFALSWFGNSATPAVVLRNTEREIPGPAADEIKRRYKASMEPGGVFVTGNDWELKPSTAVTAAQQYVDLMQYGVPDIARFIGVPADLIDGAVSGQSVTYASITQRNLQLLIMHLGPAVTRREKAFTRGLLPGPQYIKLNRKALLAMDPATQATTIQTQLNSKTLTYDEAREIDDRAPLTDEQLERMDKISGANRAQPQDVKPKEVSK